MPYVCELGANQRVFLDQSGDQTTVTTVSGSAGQQQQASSSFITGRWTAAPEVYQGDRGITVRIQSSQGDCYVQIQSSGINVMNGVPFLAGAHRIQLEHVAEMPSSIAPMKPMQPMKPLQLGDMEMSMNPMQMRMGNMEMTMGTTASTASSSSTSPQENRFCSRCGAPVEVGDRFCSSCGHSLN